MNKQTHPYEAIAVEAERLGWPMHWRTDLTEHDRGALSQPDAPKEFGWAVRSTGTDLYTAGDEFERLWAESSARLRPEQRWYWWDGSGLTELPFERFARWLAMLYERNIRGRAKVE